MSEKPTFVQLLEGAKVEVARGHGAVNCTFILAAQDKAYPRTCQRCGLGPCPFTDHLMAARPKSAEPPAPSPPMTQPDLARLEGRNTRDQQIEAICQARCMQPGLRWSDGMTEGVARIEQMLAERCLDALELPALLARVRELEAGLRSWKCGSCGGSGWYKNKFMRGAEHVEEDVPCKVCAGEGLNPIARAALALYKENPDADR